MPQGKKGSFGGGNLSSYFQTKEYIAMAQVCCDKRWNETLAKGLGLINEGRKEKGFKNGIWSFSNQGMLVQGTEMGPAGGGHASSGR